MSLFRKITETVSKGVSTAAEKAQQTVEITRLHSQANGKRKEVEKLFAEIGQAVFDAYLARDLSLAESKVIPACKTIEAIQSEIAGLEERMMELRNEKECPCGRKVPYDTRFCPSCGRKFAEPDDQAQPAAQQENLLPTETDEALPEERLEDTDAGVCAACGSSMPAESDDCPSCGLPRRTPQTE